jgi:hypothetical protein
VKRLVLAGGGHAHRVLLQAFNALRPENVEAVLVTHAFAVGEPRRREGKR